MNTLSFFLKKLFPYRLALTKGLLLAFVLTFSSIGLLTLSGWFITSSAIAGLTISTASAFNYFIPAASIRFLAIIRILSRYGDRVINHDLTFRILLKLRVWFYQKIIPLSSSFLITQRSGDLLNQMTNDINTLDHLYLNVLSPFLTGLLIAIIVPSVLAYFSISLSCILLFFIFISVVIIPTIFFKVSQLSAENIQEKTALLRITMIEALQGWLDFRLFLNKKSRVNYLDEAQKDLNAAQHVFSKIKAILLFTLQLLSGLCLLISLIDGISLVHQQILSGSALAMIIFLIIVTFEQLSIASFSAIALTKTQAAGNRLIAVTSQKPTITFPLDHKNTQKTSGDIIFKDIQFTYPNHMTPVLENFSLTIRKGEKFGITGPSGCGKTTLINLLTRIFNPNAGQITIDGYLLQDFSENQLRKLICITGQHAHIFNASVRDNLTLFQNNISDMSCYEALAKTELETLVHHLPEKLNTPMGEFGHCFSGGQIRRIVIARALLTQASIFIFDEPTVGLETSLIQKVWENCTADFQRKTVITVTHDRYLLSQMDRVMVRK